MAFGAHTELLNLFVTTLGQYPVVLGLPWLRKHDPHIRFKENTLTFDFEHCLDHCISTRQAVTIHGADVTFDTLHEIQEPTRTHESPQIHKTLHEIQELPENLDTRRSTSKPRYSPCSSHKIDMVDCTRKMNSELMLLESPSVDHTSVASRAPSRTPTADITSAARKLDISMIGAAPFNHLVQKSKKDGIQIFSVTLQNINIALTLKKPIDPATKLPSEYHDFLDVFSKSDADVLPKH